MFARAKDRLVKNEAHLAQWRAFIDRRMTDTEVMANVKAGEALDLYTQAHARKRTGAFERWCGSRRPHQRQVEEMVMRGQIRGACQYCHSSNRAWTLDNQLLRHRDLMGLGPIATPQEELSSLALYMQSLRYSHQTGTQPPPEFSQVHNANQLYAETLRLQRWMQRGQIHKPPPSTHAPATGPPIQSDMPRPTSASGHTPPVPLDIPKPRTSLCGKLPDAGDTAKPPAFDPATMGGCTRVALAAVAEIRPMLDPLGPAGYRILPSGTFSKLYDVGPSELKTMVLSNIESRRAKYAYLRSLIDAGKVPYLELCPVVDELLPTTNAKVRGLVLFEKARKDAERKMLDILIMIGAAILLLAFLFPPLGLAIGSGALLLISGLVSAGMIGTGMQDFRRGTQWELGTGAGVYSPEQEAMAGSLKAMGAMNIVMGAVGLVATGISAFKWFTAKPPALTTGGWKGMETPAGVMFVHPKHPNIAVWVEGNKITITNVAGEVIGTGVVTGGKIVPTGAAKMLPPARAPPGPRTNRLPSDAPAPGQQPAYRLPLGPQGRGGVMLMNRGLRPSDFGLQFIAENSEVLALWNQATRAATQTGQSNAYTRWLAAVQDGSVSSWSGAQLRAAFDKVRSEFLTLARARGLDMATVHHWNFPLSRYRFNIVDPRHLVAIEGQAAMRGGWHPLHQGGLHPLTTGNPMRPTAGPVAPVHEVPLMNPWYTPLANPHYPGMPYGWHPPMRVPPGY